jgi:hypothetical protein
MRTRVTPRLVARGVDTGNSVSEPMSFCDLHRSEKRIA